MENKQARREGREANGVPYVPPALRGPAAAKQGLSVLADLPPNVSSPCQAQRLDVQVLPGAAGTRSSCADARRRQRRSVTALS